MINIHGWKQSIAAALDLLPTELREQVIMNFGAVGPLRCEHCGHGWFRPDLEGPVCHVCHPGLIGVDSVELLARCPQVTVEKNGLVLACATLVKRGKASHVIVAKRILPDDGGPALTTFLDLKVGSRKAENSADVLQRAIRTGVYPHLGLSADAQGAWGWAGGLRLDGLPMAPDLFQLIEMLEREGEGEAADSVFVEPSESQQSR
jgi:hypothetical protein